MNISEKARTHIDACRFCWMCRHICPIGNATGQERNTARARALGLSLVVRDAEKTEDIIDNIYECSLCGACVKACPRQLIELRKKGPKSRRIYVACRNKDKGGVARKACEAACIGCSKCVKVCAFDAITVADNLAYIDPQKCRLCRKCAAECPTGAITEVNFPPRKEAAVAEAAE